MDLFERAVRNKIRFNTKIGFLNVEDLWDLPLTGNDYKVSLDSLAIGLNKTLKERATESFVTYVSPELEMLQLKFDVVKYIIDTRLRENREREDKMARESRRQELLTLKDKKRQEVDMSKTIEEIDKELAELA